MTRAPAEESSPRNLLTSLILVFPLFVIYQVGVLFTLPMTNGVDFVTGLLIATFRLTLPGYLIFLACVVVGFGLTLVLLKRKQSFNGRVLLPVLLESTIYALTMGSLIVLVMTKVLGISPTLAAGLPEQGLLTRLVMSVGAGVYEETVFRLGLLSGAIAVFDRLLGMRRWAAVVVAFLVSSVVFSLVHYLPGTNENFAFGSFTFRVLAGIMFGALYKLRGFAVAVYTHAFYDIFVLVVR
jgi:membrane protease YdiL (CAAX protease family)